MSIHTQVGVVEDPVLRSILMFGGGLVVIASVLVGIVVEVSSWYLAHSQTTPTRMFELVDMTTVGVTFLATAGLYIASFCMPTEERARGLAFYSTFASLLTMLFIFVCRISPWVQIRWDLF